MQLVAEEMDMQLKRWRSKIDHLASITQKAGARHKDLMYVDELKVLHAVARSKFEDWARLGAEVKIACSEMEAAFRKPLH